MVSEITPEELTHALDQCAERALWESDICRPPVDAFRLANRLGLVVARSARLGRRASFVRCAGRNSHGLGTIVLGAEPRPERCQWAVAHEIGEVLAPLVFQALSLRPELTPERSREFVANRLAKCLLLPRSWFAKDGQATAWDLLELKRIYRSASHELIAGRMLEMNPPVVITICDQGRVTWRRGSMPGQPPSMTSAEQKVWQTVLQVGRPARLNLFGTDCGIHEVRCWPVHEPGWRREILRTEVCEWD